MATTEKTTAPKAKAAPKAPAKTAAPKAAKPAAAKTVTPKAAKQTQSGVQVTVTQTKSSAGRVKSQQQTLVGLGLGRIGKTRTLTVTPAVQGMIDKVAHLIAVNPNGNSKSA